MNKITKKFLSTALIFPLIYGNSFVSAEKKLLPKWETITPLQKTATVGIPVLRIGAVGIITVKVIHDKFFANKQNGANDDKKREEPNSYRPNSFHKKEPWKIVEPSVSAQSGVEDASWLSRINDMIPKIKKIHKFLLESSGNIPDEDPINLAIFDSILGGYFEGETGTINFFN